eukprot:sb/3478945/
MLGGYGFARLYISLLQEHYEEYYEMYGETQFNFGNLFSILITNLKSEEDVKRAKRFFATVDLGRTLKSHDMRLVETLTCSQSVGSETQFDSSEHTLI